MKDKLVKIFTKDRMHISLESICKKREDEWAVAVEARLQYLEDIRAEECCYHRVCYSNFKNIRRGNKPSRFSELKCNGRGRPQNSILCNAFSKVISTVEESQTQLFSINQCIEIMSKELSGTEETAYGKTRMKEKLTSHFWEAIIFNEGTSNFIFTRKIKSIFNSFHDSQNFEGEKNSIIQRAAQFILTEIQQLPHKKTEYPEISENIQSHLDFLPASLQHFCLV